MDTSKYLGSSNPLLANITDFLVDEANAEEEEYLDTISKEKDAASSTPGAASSSLLSIDVDDTKAHASFLDKLVLYLRLVHSIDFYNALEYHQEDSMPNRCGIVFVRPAVPHNAAPSCLRVSRDECAALMRDSDAKLRSFVEYKERVDAEVATRLGLKDRRQEVDKFIKANTQELGTDRWLCPLSGKRFKGAEFIRKHLFYKHMEKIVDVKKEVEFFNNYVLDPKRPQLPEHPSNAKSQQQQQQQLNISNVPASQYNNNGGGGGATASHPQHRSHSASNGELDFLFVVRLL